MKVFNLRIGNFISGNNLRRCKPGGHAPRPPYVSVLRALVNPPPPLLMKLSSATYVCTIQVVQLRLCHLDSSLRCV